MKKIKHSNICEEIDGFVFTDSDIAQKGLDGTLTVGEWLDLDRVTGFTAENIIWIGYQAEAAFGDSDTVLFHVNF